MKNQKTPALAGNRAADVRSGLPETSRCPKVADADGFTCLNCGAFVPNEGGGTTQRNHCPRCLCSVHLDEEPGDRSAECGGLMDPIAVWVRKGGEWAVVHRCRKCGGLSSNRIAADDSALALVGLAVKPLAMPPFPLERLSELDVGTT